MDGSLCANELFARPLFVNLNFSDSHVGSDVIVGFQGLTLS